MNKTVHAVIFGSVYTFLMQSEQPNIYNIILFMHKTSSRVQSKSMSGVVSQKQDHDRKSCESSFPGDKIKTVSGTLIFQ